MNQEEVKHDIQKDFMRHIQEQKERMNLVDIEDAARRLSTLKIEENIFKNLTFNNRERRLTAKDIDEIKQMAEEEHQLRRDITLQATLAVAELVQKGVKI